MADSVYTIFDVSYSTNKSVIMPHNKTFTAESVLDALVLGGYSHEDYKTYAHWEHKGPVDPIIHEIDEFGVQWLWRCNKVK